MQKNKLKTDRDGDDCEDYDSLDEEEEFETIIELTNETYGITYRASAYFEAELD